MLNTCKDTQTLGLQQQTGKFFFLDDFNNATHGKLMKEDFLGDVELREIPIPPFFFLLLGSADGELLVQIILDARSSPNWWESNFIRTCPPSIVERGSQIKPFPARCLISFCFCFYCWLIGLM